ncbi:MAG: DPP IV N-terminal domain-containing protein [Candidatus Acidiferrales bacterium]
MIRRRFCIPFFLALAIVLLLAGPVSAQDWFKTGTGLGVQKAKVAVPDFASRTPQAQPLEKVFHDVLASDLDYSGIVDVVSPSFYPKATPSMPSELNAGDWSQPPASADMVAFGYLTADSNQLEVGGNLCDVRNPAAPPILQRIYRGAATEDDARRIAHLFADDIIARLSGGVAGIASTKIAFISNRGGSKEVWVMDYDGAHQQQLSHLRTISLTPRWSPDASRIAFTCFVPYRGVTSAQICLLSTLSNGMIAFPRFHGTNSSPAFSPDGSKIAFMSSSQGDPEIFTTDADGSHLHRLTFANGVDTSPVWNPKTGQQIIFVSDRGGVPQLYMMNSDGSNVEKIDVGDKGYVVDPSWSPNAQLVAFSWRRPEGNFDIYVLDLASHQLLELTRDAGRNERPCWAPDGRHIVFESTRTGTRHIWTMLADGSEPRQLTSAGQNESPNWSPR